MAKEAEFMSIIVTARQRGAAEEYTSLTENNLSVTMIPDAGDTVFSITAEEDFTGVIRFAVTGDRTPSPEARFFLPGFMYGTNRGEAPLVVDSKAPRLRMEADFPAHPWWMVRSDRLSHPTALMYLDGRITGFAASPYYIYSEGDRKQWKPGLAGEFDQYCGYGCSLENNEVWYTLGYENAPYMFIDSHKINPRAEMGENCFSIKKGESVTVSLHLFDMQSEDERGIHDILKWVYENYHESPRKRSTVQETVHDMAEAIADNAWIPENHSYTCFVFDKGDCFEYRLLPSISWTNGLSAAAPMLFSAHRLENEKMRSQAVDCIDHIVHCSINEKNDLPFLVEKEGVWSNSGWWYEKQNTPGHVAYLIGQSVYLILRAYAWEKKNGTEHADWLEFAKRVISRTEQGRNQDHEYPYVFSEKTGSGMEYDSFSGAWCMAAAAYYSYLTGERAYVEAMMQSEAWYHDAYIRHEECYGGPLDIDKNIDSEGILSFIRAVRYLHEIVESPEDKERLLDHMKDALYYEYTFKFCYNSPIKVPPLSKVGWSSCGGSITSVTNPHIHPMSSSILDEMAYYLRFRDDSYIRSRMEDTILWSCQCHNSFDKEFDYGRKGWMSERFCHSEGLLTETYPDGSPASTWFALMPWACGSILEGLCGEVYDGRL